MWVIMWGQLLKMLGFPNNPMGFSHLKNEMGVPTIEGNTHVPHHHPFKLDASCGRLWPGNALRQLCHRHLWTASNGRSVPCQVVFGGPNFSVWRFFLVGFPVNQNVVSISILKKQFSITIHYLHLLAMSKSP